MAINLNLGNESGGALTGSSLNLATPVDEPQVKMTELDPANANRPTTSPPQRPSAPTVPGDNAPPVSAPSLLEKPFEEFTTGDKLMWALKSGLMGGNAALRQKQSVMAAKQAQGQAITELIIDGLKVTKDIKDPGMRARAGQAIAKRIANYDGEAASSFLNVFDDPAVQNVVMSPETIQEFGSVQNALVAREENPEEFRTRAVTANIGSIESELLRLRQTDPKLTGMDANENGVITSAEARNWVRKRMQSNDTNLTLEQMNVIQMPEFEPFLADLFDARTTKATAGAQEKGLERAINKEGKLVFVTEEQLRRDQSLTPEPKKALVQFGGNQMDESLFESLVKRRDSLREQASSAQRNISLAQTMRDTAMRIQTGVGTETVADLKSLGGTLARIAGMDKLSEAISDPNLQNAEVLRSLNATAVSNIVASESAGSVSNEERRKFATSVPGLATSQGGNIAMSHIMESLANSKIEEAAFVDAVTEQVSRGQRRSDVGAQKAFSDYATDLPFSKGEGGQIRAISDGQNLWRYYLNGRPEKWIFSGGELTMDQIKTIADQQGLTARELLSQADRKGTIQGIR